MSHKKNATSLKKRPLLIASKTPRLHSSMNKGTFIAQSDELLHHLVDGVIERICLGGGEVRSPPPIGISHFGSLLFSDIR